MKTSRIAALLATALLGVAACGSSSKDNTAATTPVPPAPEFAEQDKVEAAPTAASDGDQPIAPEDQVFFALDSDDLEPRAMAMLDDVAGWVKSHPERTIIVQGHTDASGSAEHNLDLSTRRAQAVGSYLKDKGVADTQIIMTARGEVGAGLEPRESNRRVLVYATAIESASR